MCLGVKKPGRESLGEVKQFLAKTHIRWALRTDFSIFDLTSDGDIDGWDRGSLAGCRLSFGR